MKTITIDTMEIKQAVYKMLRDIEDGKYEHIEYGEAAGCLSCASTAAMDDLFKSLLGEDK